MVGLTTFLRIRLLNGSILTSKLMAALHHFLVDDPAVFYVKQTYVSGGSCRVPRC